jgi:hypothetical protein
MKTEMEMTEKEAIVTQFEVLFRDFPGGSGGNHVRIVCVPSEIQTGHLSNKIQKCYHFKQLVR